MQVHHKLQASIGVYLQNFKICNCVLLLTMMFSFTSCFTYKAYLREGAPVYAGNVYKDMVGMTKNQIMLSMPDVPDRTTSDGNGGEVMIYEDRTLVTQSNANSSASSKTVASASSSGLALGSSQALSINNSSSAMGQTVANANYSSSTTTREAKSYVNFYINSSGKCYNVQTNVGDRWKPGEPETAFSARPRIWTYLFFPWNWVGAFVKDITS